jgi:hypothetical protein
MKYLKFFEAHQNMYKGGEYNVMYENSKLYDIILEDFRAMDISSKVVRNNGGLRLSLNSTYLHNPIQLYWHGQIRHQISKNPTSYTFRSPLRSYKDVATKDQIDELLIHFYYCLLKQVYSSIKYRHENKLKDVVKKYKIKISDGPEALYTMFLKLYQDYYNDIPPIYFPKSVWDQDSKKIKYLVKLFKKYIPSKIRKSSDDFVDLTTFPEYKQILEDYSISKDITTKTHKNAGGFKLRAKNSWLTVDIYVNVSKNQILYKTEGVAAQKSGYNYNDKPKLVRFNTKVVDDATAQQFFKEFRDILDTNIAPLVNHMIMEYIMEDYKLTSYEAERFIHKNDPEKFYLEHKAFTIGEDLLLLSTKRFSSQIIKIYTSLSKFDVL